MANNTLVTEFTDHIPFNTDMSRKIVDLSKKYASDSNKIYFPTFMNKFSPKEQRFWCLVVIKRTMKNHLASELAQKEGCDEKKQYDRLYKDLEKDLEKKINRLEDPKKEVTKQEFETILETFSELTVTYLSTMNEGDQMSEAQSFLLAQLNIQKKEFISANQSIKKALVLKGLLCLALSTACVVLVVMQGCLCGVLSLPVAFLGASYAVLAYELDLITALGNALHWVKHLSENIQAKGMAALFIVGAGYYRVINADPLLEELFKSAQQILPTIPKHVLGITAAAAVPPLYFFKQWYQFNQNETLMGKLFEHPNIQFPEHPKSILRAG